MPALFRARALEWERSDFKRALVRSYRLGREPRRGREGALLLSRFHADAFLHEGALQISAGGISLRAAGRGKSPARTRRAGARVDRYRRLQRRPLLRFVRRICKGLRGRRPDSANGREPRARKGDIASAANTLVSQYLVVGANRGRVHKQTINCVGT